MDSEPKLSEGAAPVSHSTMCTLAFLLFLLFSADTQSRRDVQCSVSAGVTVPRNIFSLSQTDAFENKR